jgi:hypothetical protein
VLDLARRAVFFTEGEEDLRHEDVQYQTADHAEELTELHLAIVLDRVEPKVISEREHLPVLEIGAIVSLVLFEVDAHVELRLSDCDADEAEEVSPDLDTAEQ